MSEKQEQQSRVLNCIAGYCNCKALLFPGNPVIIGHQSITKASATTTSLNSQVCLHLLFCILFSVFRLFLKCSEHCSLAVESAVEVAGGQKIGVILIFWGLVC